MSNRDIVLKTEHLSIQFGGLRAVDDVSLEIKRASCTVLSALTVREKPRFSTF